MAHLHTTFGSLLLGGLIQQGGVRARVAHRLIERLSFDKLLQYSDPRRIERSRGVRGPALEVLQWGDSTGYAFNAKSNPSTTGLRHKCYIRFYKPKKRMPLQDVECLVDCECPDYKYRWAWANKQRKSSVVGPNSLNQAWDRAPRITNPTARIGLCKHLLALRDYIYGQYEGIGGADPETEQDADARLAQMTRRATRRWIDYQGAIVLGAERAKLNRDLAMRRKAERESEKAFRERMAQMQPTPLPPETETPKPPPGPPGYTWKSGLPRIGDALVVSRVNLIQEVQEEIADLEVQGDAAEKQEALDVLIEIRDLLQQIAGVPEPEELPGDLGDEGLELPPEETPEEVDMPPRPRGRAALGARG